MGMKVLIVGGGGREHAIATCVAKSPKVDKIYCAPGNGGISQYAECVNIAAMEFDKLADFAQEHEIDLTIIGMDELAVSLMFLKKEDSVSLDHAKMQRSSKVQKAFQKIL